MTYDTLAAESANATLAAHIAATDGARYLELADELAAVTTRLEAASRLTGHSTGAPLMSILPGFALLRQPQTIFVPVSTTSLEAAMRGMLADAPAPTVAQ